MASISTAIGTERRSRVSGYKIKKGFFDNDTPNLPQVIAVFGEANTGQIFDTEKKEITSAKEAAELYGYGSPLHQQFRILRPLSGEGVGGIPTIAFPQISTGATPSSHTWSAVGTATDNATHTVVVAGRQSLDFQNYAFTIIKGDTSTQIAVKIADAINGVLSSPVTATITGDQVTIQTKWGGETSKELITSFDNLNKGAGITYALVSTVEGAGTVDLVDAFEQMGDEWYTIVLNPYGNNETILESLEQFNGKPDDTNPTGRYVGRIFKPFVSFFGSTKGLKNELSAITNKSERINQVTNVICVAPFSDGFSCEVSANVAVIFARLAQDNPELDVNAKSYPDMPTPKDGQLRDLSDYEVRDFLVKKGCSTVILENGAYQIQDLVTTYHPEGETPLQYAYPRNLVLDWNVRDGYGILENQNVKDHVLVADGQVTDVPKSVKPKQWSAVLYDYFDALAVRALIKDPDFSKDSLRVEVDKTNPNRFNTFFRYRRTGVARIESTDVEAGF